MHMQKNVTSEAINPLDSFIIYHGIHAPIFLSNE